MIFNYAGYSLNLSDINVDTSGFKMESDSSYLQKFIKRYKNSKSYRECLLPLKLQCIFNISAYLDDYNSYYEPLAGLGITAKIFAEGVSLTLNDHSTECVDILRLNFPAETILNYDAKNLNKQADFIFTDFNNLTLTKATKEWKQLLDLTFYYANKYVLINDCSVFYLRYGNKSYQVYSRLLNQNINNIDDFYIAVVKYYKQLYPEWNLSRIEGFKDSSFLLFERSAKPVNIKINTINDIKFKTELIDV